MPIELWLAFVAASTVLLIAPGPTVMLVVGYALAHGRRSAWASVSGLALGDLTAMTLSLAGLGAVLATSAVAFTVLKLVGGAYLVYLGVKTWRAAGSAAAGVPPVRVEGGRAMFVWAFVVTALNPKSIAFFIAFLPHFVTPHAPALPQFAVLVATFVVLAMVNGAAYAWLVGGLRDRLLSGRWLRNVQRLGGGFLIGAGVATAAMSRN